MYYGIDEYGNIVSSEDSSILSEEYQAVLPSTPPEADTDVVVSDVDGSSDVTDSPLDGDQVIETSTGDTIIIQQMQPSDGIDYDELIEALASVPSYTIYPSTSAVTVFTDVLNGLDSNVGYFLFAGQSSSDVYLYYSNDYSVSGKTINLYGDVVACHYSTYRPSTSSSIQYLYQVSNPGDTTVTVTNQLVYTNLLEGYPDIIPFKQKQSYSLTFAIALSLILSCVSLFSSTLKTRRKNGGKHA